MKKLKHSKIRNTGLLFELLSTQITSDTINNRPSPALDIVKTFFRKGTNLNKELALYQILMKEKYSDTERANRLIDEVINRYTTSVNKSNLRREKYNLIKEIKTSYVLDEFIKNKVNNYKEYASIFKLLEGKQFELSPAELVTSRYTLVEFITSKPIGKSSRAGIVEEFSKQDKDIRSLAYKILLERFNNKYANLGIREKLLLREYINTISDSVGMKLYIDSQLERSKNSISSNIKKITDSATKIKLNEVINIIDNIIGKKKFNEDTLVTILHIYKLDEEVKRIASKK